MKSSQSGSERSRLRHLMPWFVLVLLLLPGAALPAAAQSPQDLLKPVDPVALADFRADLELLAKILDSQLGNQGSDRSVTRKIQALTNDEVQALFHVMPPARLAAAVDALARGITPGRADAKGPRPESSKVIVGTNDSESPPDYPTGSNYSVFTATLPGLGAISDTNGNGQLNDESCTTDYEAGLQIALAVAAVANSAAQGACAIAGADPTGIATAIACAISTATDLVQVSIEIAIAQCDFQDGAVGGAEAHATWENSRILVSALTCKQVDAPRKGHGCDGQDEDCDLVADECGEDSFAPDLTISGNLAAGWFASAAEAAAAVAGAVDARDDCQRVTVQTPAIDGACGGAVATVTASDACGNQATASTPVRIDGQRPAIAIAGSIPGSCHSSIAAAELATLAAITASDNCTSFSPSDVALSSTVTECSLLIRARVTDAAGLTADAAATVRVDTEQPRVEIERLLLGTHLPFCYATDTAAEAAVFGATRFADNCTATENLVKSVSSSGDLCNLQVTSRAVDECNVANTDSVTVRVDVTAPTASCTVQTSELDTNHEMVDVGFAYETGDNCSEISSVAFQVTSDEPTSGKGTDNQVHTPDAELLRDLDGTVTGVRLRAERTSSGDGRVYAIRVTATDRCQNTQSAVCTVAVPPNANSQAVDSGQVYDATAIN
jgi:hypothetical protein